MKRERGPKTAKKRLERKPDRKKLMTIYTFACFSVLTNSTTCNTNHDTSQTTWPNDEDVFSLLMRTLLNSLAPPVHNLRVMISSQVRFEAGTGPDSQSKRRGSGCRPATSANRALPSPSASASRRRSLPGQQVRPGTAYPPPRTCWSRGRTARSAGRSQRRRSGAASAAPPAPRSGRAPRRCL